MTNTKRSISVKVTHDNFGKAKVLAKGAGRQRTIPYDHEVSHDKNLGFAAGTLALVLGWEWSDSITFANNRFTWE
jgi:hypothetical protein